MRSSHRKKVVWVIKTCTRCGKEFEVNGGGHYLYCPDCRKPASKERKKYHRQKKKFQREMAKRFPNREPNRDCFGFVDDETCDALQMLFCVFGACDFYKPKELYDEQQKQGQTW